MGRNALRAMLIWLLFVLLPVGCGEEEPDIAPARPEGFVRLSVEEARTVAESLDLKAQGLKSYLELRMPLQRSLDYVETKAPAKIAIDHEGLRVTWGGMERTLIRLLELLPRLDGEPELLWQEFEWYELVPGPLMTAYYAPEIPASLTPSEEFRHPVYGVPKDLKRVNLGRFKSALDGQVIHYRVVDGEIEPYFDRRAIDREGALAHRELEIAWARDPVEIFYLQIQGSGFLRLPDGDLRHIQYGAKNGLAFRPLSRILVEKGHLEPGNVTRTAILRFLRDNPELRDDLLAENPSYIFFRLTDGAPSGALGRPLTPLVSLATDPGLLPLGSVIPYGMDMPPATSGGETTRVTGFALAQDTGGAIRQRRLDLYCGFGPEAEYRACRVRTSVRTFLVLVRGAGVPKKSTTADPGR